MTLQARLDLDPVARGAGAAGAADPVARLAAADWPGLLAELDAHGRAIVPRLFSPAECARWAAGYDHAAQFRSRVVMSRHGFGRGEYQYYAYPLPDPLPALRALLYERLVPLAGQWRQRLKPGGAELPATHAEFLARCHEAGQRRPTALLLQYGAGDYNCLHQDLYGDLVFPLQMAVLLSAPGRDFEGGEFVMTEQRSGHPACAEVMPLAQGDALIFAVHDRPARGARGWQRRTLRHGVAELRRGTRHTLGVILHDAR
ncbi:MAG: 2OG-Fe(II) oxygenase [Bordetella sp.]|nr:2OG-Fe(II) oxygenase [Bordetella sp.]